MKNHGLFICKCYVVAGQSFGQDTGSILRALVLRFRNGCFYWVIEWMGKVTGCIWSAVIEKLLVHLIIR